MEISSCFGTNKWRASCTLLRNKLERSLLTAPFQDRSQQPVQPRLRSRQLRRPVQIPVSLAGDQPMLQGTSPKGLAPSTPVTQCPNLISLVDGQQQIPLSQLTRGLGLWTSQLGSTAMQVPWAEQSQVPGTAPPIVTGLRPEPGFQAVSFPGVMNLRALPQPIPSTIMAQSAFTPATQLMNVSQPVIQDVRLNGQSMPLQLTTPTTQPFITLATEESSLSRPVSASS